MLMTVLRFRLLAALTTAAIAVTACGTPVDLESHSVTQSPSPSSPGATGAPGPDGAGTDAAGGPGGVVTPTNTIIANSPVFTDWDEVFRFATVTVEGSITGRVDSVSIPNDPAVKDLAWTLWELQVSDPLGANVPETLIVVDVDRESTPVTAEGLPVVREGLSGVFALDTADAEDRSVFPEHGRTYYPVVILEKTAIGYVHTVGTLPPLQSLDEIRDSVTADNERHS